MLHEETVQVQIPKRALVEAFLEKVSRQPETFFATVESRSPAIGASCDAGIYAGVTVHEERPMRLILLPGAAGPLSWEGAKEWAATQGGELPSRFDHLVLFKNLKGEFKPEYYWSAETYAGHASYAWCQRFDYGSQSCYLQTDELRARAVRRIPIE